MSVSAIEIPPEGRVVHLRGYGFVRVFKTVSKDGGRWILGERRPLHVRAEGKSMPPKINPRRFKP